MASKNTSLKSWEQLDIGDIVVRTATHVVKQRPVGVSMWVIGCLLAAFAKGFSVDDATMESYTVTLQHAKEVSSKDLSKALETLRVAEHRYQNAKGWFWSCDQKCQKAKDQVGMAQADVARVQAMEQKIVNEARREVGIWSVCGVQDVRDSFWSAWTSGKDIAARYTMMDAMFMMLPGSQEESMMSFFFKLLMQYIINLTMGLIGALFFFVYNVYHLIVSYGEPMLSGLAFFLLVMMAGLATVGTYLGAIYGTVAGGGLFLLKQAAKQAAVEGNHSQGRPRQVQYGMGRSGGFQSQRAHMD